MWLGSANVQEDLYTKAHIVPEVHHSEIPFKMTVRLGLTMTDRSVRAIPRLSADMGLSSGTMKSRNPERLISLPTAEANSALDGVCVQKLSSKEIDTRKRQPTAV